MKGNRQGYVGNILFALNLFVIFILLFESKLVVPPWLQPVGRMHPLLLHFPIVLLLLAVVLELFSFKKTYRSEKFYSSLTSYIWLAGVVTSGITVVMGLFLSHEEQYTSQTLVWHKWLGASLFFISSLFYTIRQWKGYTPLYAKAGSIITALLIIFTSHFGATITHGDNFVWEPLLNVSPPMVALEEAIVFDHVIKPVLENKCTGCHNSDKIKGELMLTDSISIRKGGKTGKLFVSDKPEQSLFFKRIHLPIENKKHMPPSGKSQLTEDEIQLMDQWIKAGTPFTQKVIGLPAKDSLRILATTLLNTRESNEEEYDFAEADEQTIKDLNSNYRIISHLAKGSPALTVNLYNRDAYHVTALEELKEIKEQIVSLELSKLPVTDSDLKVIAGFENLRKLNLNFTEITGKGLESLIRLQHLKRLYLSGTKVSFDELKQTLPSLKSLTTLAIWDTGLTADQLEQIKKDNKHITFLTGFRDDGSNPIKLNAPRIKNKSVVFEDSIALELFHPVKGVEIRFTTDGSEPDSLNAAVFQDRITLSSSTAIKTRAYKIGWQSSEVAILNVYRSGIKPDSIYLLTKLSRVHPANGALTFFDHQLGGFNANSPAWANNWAGFNNTDMKLMIEYETPKQISSLAINTLIETETYIFPPSSFEIWGGDSKDNLQLIARAKPKQPDTYRKPYIQLNDCTFPPRMVSHLMIIAKPLGKPPAWHNRKEGAALLLIDEILVN